MPGIEGAEREDYDECETGVGGLSSVARPDSRGRLSPHGPFKVSHIIFNR